MLLAQFKLELTFTGNDAGVDDTHEGPRALIAKAAGALEHRFETLGQLPVPL